MKAHHHRITLAPNVGIEVEYSDASRFGGATSPKLQQNLRRLFRPVYGALERHGPQYVVHNGEKLLRRLFGNGAMSELHDRRGRMPNSVLYPDPRKITPGAVVLSHEDGGREFRIPVARCSLPEIHDIIAELASGEGASGPGARAIARQMPPLLTADEPCRTNGTFAHADVVCLGHNTIVVRSKTTQVVVDPWFLPASNAYPADYQPITRRELGKVDCIAITHSHPDHFHPGSLLQFDRDVQVIVPRVPKESLLSLDMTGRLQELGFRRIAELDWWSTFRIGDISISAVPFFGEQPTVDDQLYPEIRNYGNAYRISSPRVSCAVVADCGRDRSGSITSAALEAYRRWGSIDVLFSGFRGWNLYPIQYFESSVRQYLLFVPPSLYGVRQSIMNNVDEAVDTAEAWHARYLVPYADGGAPWFSRIGLGPKFGPNGPEPEAEWSGFDALPEKCVKAARTRSAPLPGVVVGSVVQPLLLRPGGALSWKRKTPELVQLQKHRWPWGEMTA